MSSTSPAPASLTAEEKRQYDLKRSGFFKGTIAVMVAYGVFILGISLVGIFSAKGRELLFVNGFSFTVTFIAGTILVILLLLVQLLTYKITPKTYYPGENMTCPDYWVLKKVPSTSPAPSDKIAASFSRYYCENPDDAVLNTDMTTPTGSPGSAAAILRSAANVYKGNRIAQNYHMQCNRLYPDYLAYLDKKNFSENPTTLRCQYLKTCKNDQDPPANKRDIVWSGVCPTGRAL
jgi:hypothetical protein